METSRGPRSKSKADSSFVRRSFPFRSLRVVPHPSSMKTITKFLKVTLVGGLLVVLPLWVSLLLLLKAIKGALAMLLPIAKLLPQAVVHEKVVALGLLLVICFVVGLIIRTQPGEASRPLDRRTHTWSYS